MSAEQTAVDDFRSRVIGFALALTAIFAWGFNFVIGRYMVADVHPVILTFLRWSIASVFLLILMHRSVFANWHDIVRHRSFFIKISAIGLAGYMVTVYLALRHTPVINASLINGTSPIILLLLLFVAKAEKIRWPQVAGCLIAATGLLHLLGEGQHYPWEIVDLNAGDLWAILSAIGWAVYMLMAKRRPAGMPILTFHSVCVTTSVIILALPAAVCATLVGLPELTLREWGLIFYLGLVPSVMCFWFWNIAIQRLGAATAGITYYLIPVAASLESLLILGEDMYWFHFTSMALIISGVVIAEMKKRTTSKTGGTDMPVAT